jgi:hypothetical protein
MGREYDMHGEKRHAYRIVVGIFDIRKRPFGRLMCGWQYSKTGLKEIGLEVVDWFCLTQERGQSCEHGNKLFRSIKQGKFRDWMRNYWHLKHSANELIYDLKILP